MRELTIRDYMNICEDLSRKLEEARGRIAELEAAIKPFVEHGVALGAFDGDDGPFRYYTDKGYREVKAEDFRNARSKLEGKSTETACEAQEAPETPGAITHHKDG